MSNFYQSQSYNYPPSRPSMPIPDPNPRRRFPLTLLLTCLVLSLLVLCAVLTVGGTFYTFFVSNNQSAVIPPTSTPRPTLVPLKIYSVVGKPTVDVQFINGVLGYYNSPATGKGQALYNDGVRYGINPAYALAFFLEESNFGTKGVATVTHALGNIRANAGEPEYKGYRLYKTWEEGFADWYKLIAEKYVGEWSLSTINQIIPIYAPSSDNNDEQQYIRTIKIAIERWRNGYMDI